LHFRNDPDRFVVQGIHMLLEGDHQRPWKPGEPRSSRLVFIGRDLPEEILRDGFGRCQSPEP
ncbi:MAG: GTP-binding protein, partial [Bradyrhizobium sp.]